MRGVRVKRPNLREDEATSLLLLLLLDIWEYLMFLGAAKKARDGTAAAAISRKAKAARGFRQIAILFIISSSTAAAARCYGHLAGGRRGSRRYRHRITVS